MIDLTEEYLIICWIDFCLPTYEFTQNSVFL